MAQIIALTNQKGGVGKTSFTIHLSGVMAESGKRVLVIDLDPQGNLSSFFIENIYDLNKTVLNLLIEEEPVKNVLRRTDIPNISILPANILLADIDIKLAAMDDAQFLLLESIEPILDEFDFVLIDCPPSLGKATRMGLVASTHYLIPVECQEWPVIGIGQLTAFVKSIKKRANPRLKLLGIVINSLNSRRKIQQDMKEVLRNTYKDQVFSTEFFRSSKSGGIHI